MGLATTRVAPEKADFRPALSLPPYYAGFSPEKTMAQKLTYAEQLRHPKWQKKRLEILEAANWECEECGEAEKTLNVHHKRYRKDSMAWEYARHELMALCECCHDTHHYLKDELSDVLMFAQPSEALALCAGFTAPDGSVSDDLVYRASNLDPAVFRMGIIAAIMQQLDFSDLTKVARYAASLAPRSAVAKKLCEQWFKD